MLDRFRYVIFGAVIIAIVSGIFMLLAYRPAPVVITIIPPPPTPTPGPTATAGPVRVYVTGAVANAGQTFTLPPLSRIEDALKAAGGPNEDADLSRLNLAQFLRDGEQVHVPSANSGNANADITAPDTRPVAINSATLEDLQRLPGVGPALAQKILDYRTEHGPFKRMSDLDKISGVGPARLKDWEGKITFDLPPP